MKNYLKFAASCLLLISCSQLAQSQVKVGENPTTINSASILELESSTKGVLFPRVNLTNTTTWGLANGSTPMAGMVVYNIRSTAAGFSGTATYPAILGDGTGLYYWDGNGWVSVKGSKGEQGTAGPQGATGAQGPQGIQGLAGATGAQGEVGPQGATGAQGPQGIQGLAGATGAQGEVGPQGATGAQGPQGIQGLAGATGAQGEVGPQGATGAQGEVGPRGATGATGATGTFVATVDNGLEFSTPTNIQLGGELTKPITTIITNTTSGSNTLAITGLQPGVTTGTALDKLVVTDPATGVLKQIDQSAMAIEPWNNRLSTEKATSNNDPIYQRGNVAIGTQNGIGTFHIDAAKNNPTTGIPTASNVLDDFIVTAGGRIGFGYNPSDGSLFGNSFDDKITFQANGDLDFNYSLATTDNAQAIVHRNIISGGTIGSRTARGNGQSIAAFEGHTTTSSSNYGLGSLSTQQRAGIVLRTGKENTVGGEIWFGTSGASAGDGGKSLVTTAGNSYRAVMDQRGNWAFGSDPNFDPFYRRPTERLDLILGGIRVGALGYGALASWRTVEAAERPNYISTDPNDRLVVADANGVLKVKEAATLIPNVTTNNGITKNATTNEIELGGILNRATAINTNATNTLAITGLQNGAFKDKVLVIDQNSNIKAVSAAAPKVFWSPSVNIITDDTDPAFGTLDLYTIYQTQFASPMVSSTGASGSIPTYGNNELEYYVTWYDNTVFTNVAISATGVLTYQVISGATPTAKTFMNIVFVVK